MVWTSLHIARTHWYSVQVIIRVRPITDKEVTHSGEPVGRPGNGESSGKGGRFFVGCLSGWHAAAHAGSQQTCLSITSSTTILVKPLPDKAKLEEKRYRFDKVLPESTTQDDVFEGGLMLCLCQ